MTSSPAHRTGRRGALELSTGTLVVMILGIIIVAGGLALVWRIVAGAGEVGAELTGEQRGALGELMTRGQLVAVYPSSVEVDAGEDVAVGIGIDNRLDAQDFSVRIDITDPNGLPADTNGWGIAMQSPVRVERNARAELAVAIRPAENASAGEYAAIVSITRENGTLYDAKRFFTLRVR